MYFSKLPNIEYDQKPLKFPASETQYILAKNFFKRYKITDSAYQSSVYFNKYAIVDGDRYDIISNKFYNTPEYDWVIILTNNIINPHNDFPMNTRQVIEYTAQKYNNPEEIHHYETIEVRNSSGKIVLKSGIEVDENFYNRKVVVPPSITGERIKQYQDLIFKYYDNGTVIKKNGSDICFPVTNLEYEMKENDKKREIYILRPEYISSLISELENQLEYRESSSYIDRSTKRSGI